MPRLLRPTKLAGISGFVLEEISLLLYDRRAGRLANLIQPRPTTTTANTARPPGRTPRSRNTLSLLLFPGVGCCRCVFSLAADGPLSSDCLLLLLTRRTFD